MEKHIKIPMSRDEAASLKAGDYVYLTGTIYTARDAAHREWTKLWNGERICLLISGETGFIIWGHLPPERDGPSDRQARLRQAVWINIHPGFWIWGWGL